MSGNLPVDCRHTRRPRNIDGQDAVQFNHTSSYFIAGPTVSRGLKTQSAPIAGYQSVRRNLFLRGVLSTHRFHRSPLGLTFNLYYTGSVNWLAVHVASSQMCDDAQ